MRLYINGMIEVVCLIMVIFYLTCCTFLFFSFLSLSFPFLSFLPPPSPFSQTSAIDPGSQMEMGSLHKSDWTGSVHP